MKVWRDIHSLAVVESDNVLVNYLVECAKPLGGKVIVTKDVKNVGVRFNNESNLVPALDLLREEGFDITVGGDNWGDTVLWVNVL